TVKVVVSNTGTSGYIGADAVRFAPLVASNTDLNWTGGGDGITGPTSVGNQTNFTVSRQYTVSGAAAPASFTIAYYASTNPSTSQNFGQAMLIGTETVSAAADLSVGDHAGTSPNLQISANGSYYLFAVLNSSAAFAETSASNNVAGTSQA